MSYIPVVIPPPPALARLGARPTTLHEIETTRRSEPPTSFYMISTHFETTLPLDEVVCRIDGLFLGDAFPKRGTLRGKETVINDTGFNWKMIQENIGEEYSDAFSDESYCSTAINVLKKKNHPGVFIVEGVRLNGNRNIFEKNWREIKNVFGVDM
jgi:hypothetical protein